jgi:hypothetical protein
MKRNGFITVIVLLIMIVVMSAAIYLNYLTTLQSLIEVSSTDKIQSYYLAETKINRIVYEEDYFLNKLKPAIINHLKYPTAAIYENTIIKIENCDLDSNDSINTVNARFYDNGTREYMELTTQSKYKDITTTQINANGTLVKGMFEIGGLPLLSYDLDFKTSAEISSFYDEIKDNLNLNDIPTTIKGLYTFDHNKVIVKTNDSTLNYLTKIRNENQVTESFFKEVFFIIKNNIYNPIELVMENGNNSRILDLYGIIYLEGNLVISTNFSFNGILILKGGNIIVNTPIKPKFSGIIITDGNTDFSDDIELNYNRWYIYKYGIYLPGFLDVRIESSK